MRVGVESSPIVMSKRRDRALCVRDGVVMMRVNYSLEKFHVRG